MSWGKRTRRSIRSIAQDLAVVPVAFYTMGMDDPDGPILFASPECVTVFGFPEGFETMNLQERADVWVHPDDREEWLRKARGSTPVWDEHFRIVGPGGTTLWVHDRAMLIPRDETRPAMWMGMLADITSVLDAQEALEGSEERYRALVEQVPAVVYEMGPDDERRTLYVSPHVEAILGYPQSEWLEQRDIWTELLHPDDREIQLAAHDRHNETGEPWWREYRLIASDGREVWVRDQAVLIRDAEGHPKTWLGVMLDISERVRLEARLRRVNDQLELRVQERTAALAEANEMMSLEIDERYRAEAELRRAQDRYRRLVEHLPVVVYVWDVEGEEQRDRQKPSRNYISPQIEQLVGYTPEEWLTVESFWTTRVHPHDRDGVLAEARRITATGEPFNMEMRYLAKDGRVVWVLDQATLLERDERGRPRTYQGALVDITAQKVAEANALESERKYLEIVEESPVVFFHYKLDPEGEHTMHYVGRNVWAQLGYTDERVVDADVWIRAVHPDDRELVGREMARTIETGAPWSFDHRLIAADGRIVWFHTEGRTADHDAAGRPQSFHGILLDVTAAKEETDGLRERADRLDEHVSGIPAIPYTESTDPTTGQGRLLFIGPQVEKVLGYSPEELISEPDHLARMVHPEDRDRVLRDGRRIHQKGEPRDMTYRVYARDRRIVWLRSMASPTLDETGRWIWHGIALDVSHEHPVDEGAQMRGDSVRTPSGR